MKGIKKMLNHIVVQGRLVRDIEVRFTNTQVPVATFTLAVERNHTNGTERVADFIDIVAWRGIAEFAAKYFAKGALMIVEGSLQSRKWQDKNGNNRVNWEVLANQVHFSESRKASSEPTPVEPTFTEVEDNEELPF